MDQRFLAMRVDHPVQNGGRTVTADSGVMALCMMKAAGVEAAADDGLDGGSSAMNGSGESGITTSSGSSHQHYNRNQQVQNGGQIVTTDSGVMALCTMKVNGEAVQNNGHDSGTSAMNGSGENGITTSSGSSHQHYNQNQQNIYTNTELRGDDGGYGERLLKNHDSNKTNKPMKTTTTKWLTTPTALITSSLLAHKDITAYQPTTSELYHLSMHSSQQQVHCDCLPAPPTQTNHHQHANMSFLYDIYNKSLFTTMSSSSVLNRPMNLLKHEEQDLSPGDKPTSPPKNASATSIASKANASTNTTTAAMMNHATNTVSTSPSFPSYTARVAHSVPSERRPYSCETCFKCFTTSGNLKQHVVIHSGEKIYTCKECNKSFNHSSNLKEHLRVHTGERPFACDVCAKAFARSGSLKEHMRRHTGERPFTCIICQKAFSTSSNLKQHLTIHSGEKLYSCKVCAKAFNHSSNLKEHLRIHTGEKPFSCHMCNKSFCKSSNLNKHMSVHSDTSEQKPPAYLYAPTSPPPACLACDRTTAAFPPKNTGKKTSLPPAASFAVHHDNHHHHGSHALLNRHAINDFQVGQVV